MFDARDDTAAPPAAVITQASALELFGTADAVGRTLLVRVWSPPPVKTMTVIGIVRDSKDYRSTKPGSTIYVPFAQHYEPNLAVVARTSGDPAQVTRVLQTSLRQADPDLGTGTVGPVLQLVAGPFVSAKLAGFITVALGGLALAFAMCELYGVQTHLVERRTREVGVRMSLGATTADVKKMILGQGFRPVVEGMGFIDLSGL